jgi:hypothetical protein
MLGSFIASHFVRLEVRLIFLIMKATDPAEGLIWTAQLEEEYCVRSQKQAVVEKSTCEN